MLILGMRTTLNIGDDVMAEVRALAEREGISLGKALSELARRGFSDADRTAVKRKRGTFAVDPDAKPITNKDVYRALNDWP